MIKHVLHVKVGNPLSASTALPASSRNGKTKVTEELINKIKELHIKNVALPEIARVVKIAYSTVWRVVNGFHKPRQQKLNTRKKKFFEHDQFYI